MESSMPTLISLRSNRRSDRTLPKKSQLIRSSLSKVLSKRRLNTQVYTTCRIEENILKVADNSVCVNIKGSQDEFVSLLAKTINFYHKISNRLEKNNIIERVFYICNNRIDQNLYCYEYVEDQLRALKVSIDEYQSISFSFLNYIFMGRVMYEYLNYTISLQYFDKALKLLNDNNHIQSYQRKLQSIAYKTISKILLTKGDIELSRQFAIKHLRKAWYCNNIEEELQAYDYLGSIQYQINNICTSRYFHQRMYSSITQKPLLKMLSTLELQKNQKIKIQRSSHSISKFIEKDKPFNQMILKNYETESMKLQSDEIYEYQGRRINKIIIITHRSNNRQLKNYYNIPNKETVGKQRKQQYHLPNKNQVRRIHSLVFMYKKFIRKLQIQLEIQRSKIFQKQN